MESTKIYKNTKKQKNRRKIAKEMMLFYENNLKIPPPPLGGGGEIFFREAKPKRHFLLVFRRFCLRKLNFPFFIGEAGKFFFLESLCAEEIFCMKQKLFSKSLILQKLLDKGKFPHETNLFSKKKLLDKGKAFFFTIWLPGKGTFPHETKAFNGAGQRKIFL